MAELIREISDVGLSSREGCGNTVRNVTADPWAGVCHDELWDPTPYVGAYVRYFVRHPTTQLMPRKVKTAFTGSDTDRALTGIHDIAFIARERDGVRGFEIRVGGGTSIMPRVAPTLVDFVTAEDGEYLKWAEAVFRIFDRQDWLRVNRARARIKVLVDKVGIDARARAWSTRSCRATGSPSATSRSTTACSSTTRRPTRRRRRSAYGSPNGDGSEFERFRRGQRRAPAPGRLLRRPGQGRPRRPDARAVPRAGGDHARLLRRLRAHDRAPEPAAALGPRRGRLRRLAPAGRARASATRARTRSTTSSPAPAPTPASSASRARWGSTARSRSGSRR